MGADFSDLPGRSQSTMIKIQPFLATDSTQVKALLRHQNEPVPYETFCAEERVLNTGFTFWQHWLPCGWHIAPSVYVAKESGVVLGLISLEHTGSSKSCFRVDHLVVHPQHRGRGIGQELLRFALSVFGSQGINHFVSEISDLNSRGLALFTTTGFRRLAKVTYYQVPLDHPNERLPDELFESASEKYRLAEPGDAQGIFALSQEVMPSEVRRIFDFVTGDFEAPEVRGDNLSKLTRSLIRKKVWYWLSEDKERGVIPCAAKVIAHREGDYHLEFLVNPGWSHMTRELVEFVLAFMQKAEMKGMVVIKSYDYQKELGVQLEELGLEREGSFTLLAREHWSRARRKRSITLDQVTIPNLGSGTPAINMPFSASEVLENF